MDGQQQSNQSAEKQKIREMIRDAVRILIQNTVSHHTKLSVEALFGITIDDGEDSFFFSIHDSIGAVADKAYSTEEQYGNAEVDASYPSYDLQDTAVNNSEMNHSIAYDQQYKPAVPYQAVVKKETSVISYNVGHDAFPHNSIATNEMASQYFSSDGSYSGFENTDYGYHSAFGVGGEQKLGPYGLQRGRGRGRILKRALRRNVTSARSLPTVNQRHESEVDTTVGGRKRSLDTGEVSTVYTCQRCGKQMNHRDSFRRHKKSHLGIVYRCDGCGKVCSRLDNLKAHQRHCLAAQHLTPLD